MSRMQEEIDALQRRLAQAQAALGLEVTRARATQLQSQMEDPAFWNDHDRARGIAQEAAELTREVESWDAIAAEIHDAAELATMSEDDPALHAQAATALEDLSTRFAAMEFRMLFSGTYDSRNAVISLHAGAGGTDANDWTAMLLRMFVRFAERKGWSVDVLEESMGEEAGYKSVTMLVRGRFAYGWLKSEHGVHRLVRISPFDAEQMRHTTFALVEVVPEFADIDSDAVVLDPQDLRIDTFMSSGKGGQSVNTTYSAVRVTHLPTGMVASCQNERSQSQNKEIALRMLRGKLFRLMEAARAKDIAEVKGEHKTAAWGNQIRSYVLHPYKMVKDHRTGVQVSDPDRVLDGDLDGFIEAFLRGVVADAREGSEDV